MSTDLMEKLVSRLLKPVLGLLLAVLGLVALSGCGGPAEEGEAAGGDGSGGEISLVAYSTPKEAYGELIPAFNKTPQGKGVKFTQSYGASGDQARAVEAGLPADLVALSLAPDVDKLIEPGIVAGDWADNASEGFVTNSVVVFAVPGVQCRQRQCALRGTGRASGGRAAGRWGGGENRRAGTGPARTDRRCCPAGDPAGCRGGGS
jgi:ABC-type sulfate transport system substrate-binding protein